MLAMIELAFESFLWTNTRSLSTRICSRHGDLTALRILQVVTAQVSDNTQVGTSLSSASSVTPWSNPPSPNGLESRRGSDTLRPHESRRQEYPPFEDRWRFRRNACALLAFQEQIRVRQG